MEEERQKEQRAAFPPKLGTNVPKTVRFLYGCGDFNPGIDICFHDGIGCYRNVRWQPWPSGTAPVPVGVECEVRGGSR